MAKRLDKEQINEAVRNLKSAASGAQRSADSLARARRSLEQAVSSSNQGVNHAYQQETGYGSNYGGTSHDSGELERARNAVSQIEQEHRSAMDSLGSARNAVELLLRAVDSELEKTESDARGVDQKVQGLVGAVEKQKLENFRSGLKKEAGELRNWADDLRNALRQSSDSGRVSGGSGSGLEGRLGGGAFKAQTSSGFSLPRGYSFERSYYPSIERQLGANPYRNNSPYNNMDKGLCKETYSKLNATLNYLIR